MAVRIKVASSNEHTRKHNKKVHELNQVTLDPDGSDISRALDQLESQMAAYDTSHAATTTVADFNNIIVALLDTSMARVRDTLERAAHRLLVPEYQSLDLGVSNSIAQQLRAPELAHSSGVANSHAHQECGRLLQVLQENANVSADARVRMLLDAIVTLQSRLVKLYDAVARSNSAYEAELLSTEQQFVNDLVVMLKSQLRALDHQVADIERTFQDTSQFIGEKMSARAAQAEQQSTDEQYDNFMQVVMGNRASPGAFSKSAAADSVARAQARAQDVLHLETQKTLKELGAQTIKAISTRAVVLARDRRDAVAALDANMDAALQLLMRERAQTEALLRQYEKQVFLADSVLANTVARLSDACAEAHEAAQTDAQHTQLLAHQRAMEAAITQFDSL